MTRTIQLTQRWVLGAQIGKGGFGRVFEAVGDDERLAACKLIPKEPGADRELLFENLDGIRGVVPIIDSGEENEYWVVVMPRATISLRAHLTDRSILPTEEVVAILHDVATALVDLQGRIVHRDIKPENVLLLNNQWCLSDFGIARYVEASTAAETHKWSWTAPYNPPERWRGERATDASDIYSLGVMAFEMVSGYLPFRGPDFRNEHLTKNPPSLTSCPALLASLVTECLLKAPEVRPTAANILAKLARTPSQSSVAAAELQAANQAQVQRLSKETSMQSAVRASAERRREISASAITVLSIVAERLGQMIRDNAPTAVWLPWPERAVIGSLVQLGSATLSFGRVEKSGEDAWGEFKPRFDVIAHATIGVKIPPDASQYEGRSHSLWFCDAQESGVFRWYETAFMFHPFSQKRGHQNPFDLEPGEESGAALSPGIAEFQVAWPFTPVEPGNEVDFLERWMAWFAQAAQGQLSYPSQMPERSPEGTWRR